MPKWSKDATEFTVNVFHSDDKGSQVRIPKPILEKIGNPDKITFVITGKDVKIIPEVEQARQSMIRKKLIEKK